MAARSIAALTLSFGLVSIPVRLYSATESSASVRFNLLAKFANAWGLLKFQANLLRGRYRIIEYK